MVRTAAAVVTLLISTVLLHLATPHEIAVSGPVSQQTAAQMDIIRAEPVGSGCPHRGPADHQPDSVDGRVARAVHSQSVDTSPPSAVVLDWGVSAVLAGPVHARTARDGCSPTAAVAPTCAVLQSFRC